MLYRVRYSETYASTYLIEAEDENEAREKLYAGIQDGDLDGPDTCVGSQAEVHEVKN